MGTAISFSSGAWWSPGVMSVETGWGMKPLEGDIGPAKPCLGGSGVVREFLDPITFPTATCTPVATLRPRKPYKVRGSNRKMDSVWLPKLSVLLFLAFSLFLRREWIDF